MINKNLNSLVDMDILVTILRLAFYSPENADPSLTITFVEILRHLNLASSVKKERIKEALQTLMDVPLNIDGLEETPVITHLYFLENGAGITIYFHSKIYLALQRGYFFDGLDYMPVQGINREAKEKAKI